MAHCGYGEWDKSIRLAVEYPNVHLEITGTHNPRGIIEKMVRGAARRRCALTARISQWSTRITSSAASCVPASPMRPAQHPSTGTGGLLQTVRSKLAVMQWLTPEKARIFRATHIDNMPWILDHGLYCQSAPSPIQSSDRSAIRISF